MVEVNSGGLFDPIQFNLTKGIEFLQRSQQIRLEASRQMLAAQQSQFDQKMATETMALRRAESAQKLLESEAQTENLKARTEQTRQEMELQSSMGTFIEGLKGLSPADAARRVQGYLRNPAGVNTRLGAGRGSTNPLRGIVDWFQDLVTGFGQQAMDGPMFFDEQEGKFVDQSGEPLPFFEFSGSANQSDLAEDLARYGDSKLRPLPDSEKELFGRLEKVPETQIGDALRAMHDEVSGVQIVLGQMGSALGESAIGGQVRDRITKQQELIADTMRQWNEYQSVLGGGPITPANRAAYDRFMDMDLKRWAHSESRYTTENLSRKILGTGVVPKNIGTLWLDAANSNDPTAQVRAAMLYEKLVTGFNDPAERAALRQSIKDAGGENLLARFETINVSRRSASSIERALLTQEASIAGRADEGLSLGEVVGLAEESRENDAKFSQYARDVVNAASEVRTRAVEVAEANAALPEEKQLTMEVFDKEILGDDRLFDAFAWSIMDKADISRSDIPDSTWPTFRLDAWTAWLRTDPLRSKGSRMADVADQLKTRWGRSFTGKGFIVRRPVEFAKSEGWGNMDPDLADRVAKAQAQYEIIDTLPGNARISDFTVSDTLLQSGLRAYTFHSLNQRVRGDIEKPWRPDYSRDGMVQLWHRSRAAKQLVDAWRNTVTGEFPIEPGSGPTETDYMLADLFDDLDEAMAESSPGRIQKANREFERAKLKNEKGRSRLSGEGDPFIDTPFIGPRPVEGGGG